jgi:multidrug efflux pump subunit AcrB
MTCQAGIRRLALLALLSAALGSLGCLEQGTTERPQVAPAKPGPTITVQGMYPGASSQVTADTVAAPIEQQINGVEGMVSLSSRCTNDGACSVSVAFRSGVDPKRARALVQALVKLALGILPEVVKRDGLTVKEKPAGVLLFVKVSSPDRSRDNLFLSNHAVTHLLMPLAALPGVAEVKCIGQRDYSFRVIPDPTRLAGLKLTVTDVIQALSAQNVQVRPGQKAKGKKDSDAVVLLETQGRLADAEELQEVILKVDAAGRMVRLKDVARIELGTNPVTSEACHKGELCVLLAIAPTLQARPKEVSAAVAEKLTQMQKHLPRGIRLELAFDLAPSLKPRERRTSPEYLLLDVTLPDSAARERIVRTLEACQGDLRDIEGVQDSLALTDHPFDGVTNRPCILVRLTPPGKREVSRDKIAQAIRTRLAEMPAMLVRIRDLSGGWPRWGYPIDLVVHGPDARRVRDFAIEVGERLRKRKKLTDVWVKPDTNPRPLLYLDLDRTAVKEKGVALKDVLTTLEATLGTVHVNDFNRFGRTWQVCVAASGPARLRPEGIKELKLRNSKGEMVALGELVKVRTLEAPIAINRLNLEPAVELTANPAVGISLSQARTLCETLSKDVRRELRLTAAYRLTWLRELPAPK